MWYPHTSPDIDAFAKGCMSQFNATLLPNAANTRFGGFRFADGVSNIIFSNGEKRVSFVLRSLQVSDAAAGLLDPWSSLGVRSSLSSTLPAIVIPEAAHHLDLRGPNRDDPPYVQRARAQEAKYIEQWIDEWYEKHSSGSAARSKSKSKIDLSALFQ